MKNVIHVLKTNENNARTKLLLGLGITAVATAAGVVLVKYAADQRNVILVLEEAADILTDTSPTE